MRKQQWGLYIHIPFCRQKCFYCDFPSFAGRERYEADYTDALCRELAVQGVLYREKWGSPRTIYMGGGTPSLLPIGLLAKILQAIADVFGDAADREFTVECNPGTVDAAKLRALRAGGVNRLSFGVQTFDDTLLKKIGRIHTGAQAREAMALARTAGFQNVSMDLIYGLPGESLAELERDLEAMVALEPEHISIYGLQLEEGTAFAKMQEMGRLMLPDDDTVERMYDTMTAFLPAHGYARYEISNFAKPGFESRHNLSYWQDVPYLGVGAAAHSYLEGQRYENVREIPAYIEGIRTGKGVRRQEETMTREIAMEEFAFLALRTARGIDRARFERRFGVPLEAVYADAIAKLKRQGLLEADEAGVHLTPLGMKYGNMAFEEFLL
ncbi:radical SAM family heme chaperone HemW [Mitsuokella multacida]|uniref:radical SAM family heme chaperone HemW n=1 Tax=Mitsuokella multacida TaxID=52226 RepID=UPI001F2C1056|nr:radical SAM family heme chaperone HemW [Mitsuokella multacida]MCF2583665.1 radical SAM family heme chaperone HemW [Mitsuokella multacida]MDO5582513.1 radical SAM family heme chaperone HemW [Mitsuokella multacida]